MHRRVAFVGPKGAGKDTIADALVARRDGTRFIKASFATNLKNICHHVFRLTDFQMHDHVGKERAFDEPLVIQSHHLHEVRHRCALILPGRPSIVLPEQLWTCESPRQLLQTVGVYIREHMGLDWHLDACLASSDAEAARVFDGVRPVCVLFCDCRFENELAAVGGENAFYIHRDVAEAVLATATHPSETNVRTLRHIIGDRVIENSGTIDEAVAQALSAIA